MLQRLTLILVFIVYMDSYAQKVFTTCNVMFNTAYQPRPGTGILSPGLTRDFPREGAVKVTMKIINGLPIITNLKVLESANAELIEYNTRENLKLLSYLQDTLNYTITFKYESDPNITNNYGKTVGDTIIITSRDFPILPNCSFRSFGKIDSELMGDKLTLTYTIERILNTDSYLHSSSDILVERVFDSSQDLIVLAKNNYPELTNKIIEDAQRVSEQPLKEELERYMRNVKFKSGLPKKYFIRYHLHREICGVHQNR